MKDVKWIDGAPEKLEPGMLVLDAHGHVHIAGNINSERIELTHLRRGYITAWACLIQTHELEWVERMAKAHGAGEQGKAE